MCRAEEALALAPWTADEGRGSKLVPTVCQDHGGMGRSTDALWYTYFSSGPLVAWVTGMSPCLAAVNMLWNMWQHSNKHFSAQTRRNIILTRYSKWFCSKSLSEEEIYIFNIHLYVYECLTFMYICIPCVCLAPAEASRVHRTRAVTSSYDLSCGCWKLNPDLLEQQVLLPTEPALQPV